MKENLMNKFNEEQVLTTAQIELLGINRVMLKKMVDAGELVRIDRGLYSLPDEIIDDLLVVQKKFPKGVFSHRTALYQWGLITEIPQKFHMTFPRGYHPNNVKKLRKLTIPHFQDEEAYSRDIVATKSFFGNKINIYSPERSIIDIWRSNEDPNVQNEALNNYFDSNFKNINLLNKKVINFSKTNRLISALEVLENSK